MSQFITVAHKPVTGYTYYELVNRGDVMKDSFNKKSIREQKRLFGRYFRKLRDNELKRGLRIAEKQTKKHKSNDKTGNNRYFNKEYRWFLQSYQQKSKKQQQNNHDSFNDELNEYLTPVIEEVFDSEWDLEIEDRIERDYLEWLDKQFNDDDCPYFEYEDKYDNGNDDYDDMEYFEEQAKYTPNYPTSEEVKSKGYDIPDDDIVNYRFKNSWNRREL